MASPGTIAIEWTRLVASGALKVAKRDGSVKVWYRDPAKRDDSMRDAEGRDAPRSESPPGGGPFFFHYPE
ncbi:hypothetical protein GCM10027022_16370 [Alpinimonas psychrophila]